MYYHNMAIPRIKKYLGDVKILMILRNPVDRAFSSYCHFVTMNLPGQSSFEDELKKEDNRRSNGWDFMWFHTGLGFYYEQVKAYMENFSQVKVYLFDDLINNPASMIRSIYEYLDVDSSLIPVFEKHNISGVPRSKLMQTFIFRENFIRAALRPFVKMVLSKEKRDELRLRLVKMNLQETMKMKSETREYLKSQYRADILKLQRLIKRDMTSWLENQ